MLSSCLRSAEGLLYTEAYITGRRDDDGVAITKTAPIPRTSSVDIRWGWNVLLTEMDTPRSSSVPKVVKFLKTSSFGVVPVSCRARIEIPVSEQ